MGYEFLSFFIYRYVCVIASFPVFEQKINSRALKEETLKGMIVHKPGNERTSVHQRQETKETFQAVGADSDSSRRSRLANDQISVGETIAVAFDGFHYANTGLMWLEPV